MRKCRFTFLPSCFAFVHATAVDGLLDETSAAGVFASMSTSPTTSPTRDWLFVSDLRLDAHTDVAENTIVATYCFEAKPFSDPIMCARHSIVVGCAFRIHPCILTGQTRKNRSARIK